MKLLPRRRAVAPEPPARPPRLKNRMQADAPPLIDTPPPEAVATGNRIPRTPERGPEVSPFEPTPLGLHTRAVGWKQITRPELFVLVALEDGRWHRWQTVCDVARDLDIDRDTMLAALDAWGVAYSDGSDVRYGERQWCRLPGITFDAEDRSAELARATRLVVCALAGRPLRSRALVEAAGRLQVPARSVCAGGDRRG